MAWVHNQQIWPRLDQPHSTRMHREIVDNHGEPLLMNNQELYSVMVQINWTMKTQAPTNMQILWRPKGAGKWHPFQWEAILHCPTAEGHRAVPSSVSRNGDCLHVWLTGRAHKAVSKNALQASRPGIRGRCTVPLHVAEHAAMRTAICLKGASKQGGGKTRQRLWEERDRENGWAG